ncbi:unnamed protein product [Sympodiomycopsis kandeliae]
MMSGSGASRDADLRQGGDGEQEISAKGNDKDLEIYHTDSQKSPKSSTSDERKVPRYPSNTFTTSSSHDPSIQTQTYSADPATSRRNSSDSGKTSSSSSSQKGGLIKSTHPEDEGSDTNSVKEGMITSPHPRRSMLGNRNSRISRTSSDSFGDLFGNNDEVDMAARGSPTRRRSAGKLVSFIDKLKPTRHGPGVGAGGVLTALSSGGTSDGEGPYHGDAKSGRSSKVASGKHTPSHSKQPTGDYGNFLKAAELQEKLEKEQEKVVQRELKLAKQKKRKPSSAPRGGKIPLEKRISDLSDMQQDDAAPVEPLEKSKQFPGGFDPELDEESRQTAADTGHRHEQYNLHRRRSDRSSPQTEYPRSSPPKEKRSDGMRSESTQSSLAFGARTPAYSEDPNDENGATWASSHGKASGSTRPVLSRSGSHSSWSSTGSYGGDTVTSFPYDTQQGPTALQDHKVKNASTISLKSWNSNGSGGGASLASGGANPKLQGPLLELEELELRSFLKNFNRHTREVRVPASLHFPRRRMPQWDDFKIPPGERELAAKQGKRVTVLTHVDRGLQVLANEEGQGAPLPRNSCATSGLENKKDKKSFKQSKSNSNVANSSANMLSSAGSSSPQNEHGTSRKGRVTFHPDTGFLPEGLSSHAEEGAEAVDRFAKSFGNSGDKDERKAKRQEAQRAQQESDKNSPDDPPPIHDIHDSQTELRPSSDQVGLTGGTWEVINAQGEHETELDPTDGDAVDGVAFCIAYILALVERYAPDELDNTPDQTYREGRARSHLERLYIIAPFWERLLFGLRRLYRWDNPRRTATAAMIYFVLWWTDLLPTAFLLALMYYILQFRFFPPDVSYLHERVRDRMARGVEADKLAERLRRRSRLDVLDIYKRFTSKYGVAVQLAAGDIADFHEKVKNLILWRNPPATWRTLTLFGIATIFVTFAPAYYIWKFVLFFIGFTFFCLLPLQSHYPRYRRPLSPFWWALWSVPSDRQFAIQLLRRRHLERAQADMAGNKKASAHAPREGNDESSGVQDGSKSGNLKKRSQAAQAVKYGFMKPVTGEEQKLFGLEEEVEQGEDGEKRFKPKKLGSFFCQHHGAPGHLTITTRQIYFRGLGRSKSCKTPLEDIAGLSKTKSLQLFVWSSSGLQVARVNKRSLFFSNMVKRDEAFNLILAVGSEVWSQR